MNDDLAELLTLGMADLETTLGETVTMAERGTPYAAGVGAVISAGGMGYELELGGAVLKYTATALIEKRLLPRRPKTGDTLTTAAGIRYTVSRVTDSAHDIAYTIELAQ